MSEFESCHFPIIDLEHGDPQVLRDSLDRYGFFYLKTSLAPASLLAEVHSQSVRFFSQPLALKQLALANAYNRGYTPFREEVLDPAVQQGGDLKEGYYLGSEPPLGPDGQPVLDSSFAGPNVYPPNLGPEWREAMLRYHGAMCEVGQRTAGLLALALGMEEGFFAPFLRPPLALLRLLHYSEDRSDVAQGLFGAGAHSDYGMLTFLWTDGTPGLQVLLRDGRWYNVPHVEGCFVVNIGDMVQRWTNDHITSTVHRVVKLVPQERYSMPFFYEPNFNTEVVCLPQFCVDREARYPPTTSGQHLLDKYKQTHTSFVDPREEKKSE